MKNWKPRDVHELIAELVEEFPEYERSTSENEHAIGEIYRARAKAEPTGEYAAAAINYALVHAFAYWRRENQPQRQRPSEGDPKIAVIKHVKEEYLLLNRVMDNGKQLRFCSAKDLHEFAEKCLADGAAFECMAKKVGDKLVGQVLSENEVRKIWR